MEGHAPHGQNDASDTRFVACPGKAEGRNEAERPPALQAPPGRTNGGHGARAAPPPQPAPRHTNATDPPHGWRTAPSQVGGRPPTIPAARSSHRACRPRGQCWAPTPTRHAHSTWVADPNSPPSGRAVGGGGAPGPRRPTQQWKAPPPGTPFRHPHNPKPSRGKTGPDRPPPKHARRSKGPGQDTRRGTDHVERPYQRPLPGPREVRTPNHPGGGGGRRGSASAHTRKGHVGTTRRATGPSSRNAQTAWNGVPASEGKGHPDGTARHTQRGTRRAGRGKRERHNTRYRPELPEPAASAAHTQTGHCTRQGSSGALRHPPTPRLASLRASPRGSHWRQASSTGPAALALRATTH